MKVSYMTPFIVGGGCSGSTKAFTPEAFSCWWLSWGQSKVSCIKHLAGDAGAFGSTTKGS